MAASLDEIQPYDLFQIELEILMDNYLRSLNSIKSRKIYKIAK